MNLSKNAEKILVELHQLDLEDILGNPEFWQKKTGRMSKEKQAKLMEALEELESDGYIVMSMQEMPDGNLIPQKVLVKKR